MELYVVCLVGVAILATIIIQGVYCGFFCFYPLAPGVKPLCGSGFKISRTKREDKYEMEVPLEKKDVSLTIEEEKEKESQTDV